MPTQPSQPNKPKVTIKAPDDTLQGRYANAVQVAHTREEFVLDFLNLFPPQGVLNARIILSPGHLKRMTMALKENLKKYEEKFGEIKEAKVPQSDFGFAANKKDGEVGH